MMNPSKIIEAVEKHEIDISPWTTSFEEPLRRFVLHHNYYWGLAAYVDLFKPKRVLEFGTCTGASAVVMARAGAVVDTWDLSDEFRHQAGDFPENVNCNIAETPEAIRDVIDSSLYDIIFVDIDHMGEEEQRIHEWLLEKRYRGLVFYDDIKLNEQMKTFWDGIEQEKHECEWHGASGFGLVRYV